MSVTENDSIMTTKLAVTVSQSSSNEVQFCWICFATSKEDVLAEWVQPCKCSGTVRWVHQKCLQRWVDEKQKGNSFKPVQCPHCLTEYIIVLPRMGVMIRILHEINELVKVFCPFLAAGLGVVILYWTSVTYGAITVLQIMGFDEGMKILERTQPLALIIGLPAIPVTLILSQFLKWDDMILSCIRKEPYATRRNIEENSSFQLTESSNPVSGARVLCSALLLPTVSALVGRVFKTIESNVLKTIFGGLTFIAIKAISKIALQQSEFIRKRHKRILDYNEGNLLEFVNNHADRSSLHSGSNDVDSNTSMELLVIENLLQIQ